MRNTSLSAYAQISAQGLLSKLRFECYKILAENGPSTATELVTITKNKNPNSTYAYIDSIPKRLSELRELGVATELGKRSCKITGREAIIWAITDDLPKEMTAKERLEIQIKKTEERLSSLRNKLQEMEQQQ